MDSLASRFEVALELGSPATNIVGALKRLHPLNQRTLWCGDGFGWGITDRRHGGRLYILRAADHTFTGQFRLDLNLSLSIVEDGCDDQPTLQGVFVG